jgi:hypothetical protein
MTDPFTEASPIDPHAAPQSTIGAVLPVVGVCAAIVVGWNLLTSEPVLRAVVWVLMALHIN